MAPGPDTPRPDYGVDAPGTVRTLLLVGAVGLLAGLTAVAGLWPGTAGGVDLASPAAGVGVGFTLTGLGMLWSSKVGKLRARERLLDHVPWRGDEKVLDVGCGRGLMLVGAARRVPAGRATGVDVWQAEDLSGNRPEAALENARREGVADRVEVVTADMRQTPFPDGAFDVVVSNWAVHNLYDPADRVRAVAEIVRVLRPGGVVVLRDIRHGREYARAFAAGGCPDARRVGSRLLAAAAAVVTFGAVQPTTLVVRKPG